MTAAVERSDISAQRDSEESTDPMLENEPIDSSENADPTLAMEANEPTLPIERKDPREPIERNESCDQSDSRELEVADLT